MKYKCRVRWGDANQQREVYGGKYGSKPSEYSFDSQAELDAFLEGVEEGVGYLDCDVRIGAEPFDEIDEDEDEDDE